MTRRTTNIALLFVLIIFPTVLTRAQAPAVGDEAATPRLPNPQLEFVGQETYEVNGSKGTRYKLRVTNRASHPDFLWRPTQHLPPCGKNENASRTWVEIFGSPGDKRLAGFCALRASEDLGHLWFPVPSGEKGPPCVYIVMTDRRTGKKYTSNRVCSRLFALTTGSLKSSDKPSQSAAKGNEGSKGWIQIDTVQFNKQKPGKVLSEGPAPVEGGSGRDQVSSFGNGNKSTLGPTNKRTGLAQSDLVIKQFLFPPTNDKALRVQVANDGAAAAGASRLLITVRKINGTPVGRQTHVNIPALAPGKKVWLLIDAKSILPVNVSLKSTTFKLNADATGLVAESDETNNEVWHGLPATAAIGKAIGGFANDGDEADAREPETTDTQKLSTEQRERSKLSCRNVSARWQVCGSVSRTRFVAGVGIRFNQLDPNGKRIASRSYEHCSELAADQTIPADIRAQAAAPCKQMLQLAAKEAAAQ